MMRGGRRSSSLRLEFAGRRSSWWKVELAGGVRVGCREGRKMTAGVPRLFLGSDAPEGVGRCTFRCRCRWFRNEAGARMSMARQGGRQQVCHLISLEAEWLRQN